MPPQRGLWHRNRASSALSRGADRSIDVTNAVLAAYSIQQELRTSDPAELQTVYGVYLLETRQVWAPRVGEMKGIGLTPAPRDTEEFMDLGNAILQSDRIKSLLRP